MTNVTWGHGLLSIVGTHKWWHRVFKHGPFGEFALVGIKHGQPCGK